MNLQSPNYTGFHSYLVQQERPDGSLWSVEIFNDTDSKPIALEYADTEAAAEALGLRRLQEAHG
jgi:hypothetical protein